MAKVEQQLPTLKDLKELSSRLESTELTLPVNPKEDSIQALSLPRKNQNPARAKLVNLTKK